MLPHSTVVNKSQKKIYINPNFKGQLPMPETLQSKHTTEIPTNAHINPLFLKSHICKNAIHMNPAFLQNFQESQKLNREIQTTLPNDPKIVLFDPSNNITSIRCLEKGTTQGRKIIRNSKNCLIREPLNKIGHQTLGTNSSPVMQPLLVLNKRKLIRKLPLLSETFSTTKLSELNNFQTKITKYKLDNRFVRKKPLLPPTPKIKRTSFVGQYALRRTSFSEPTTISDGKAFVKNKKLQVLNINGLLYKSTRNSLKLKEMETNGKLKSYDPSTIRGKTSVNANQGLTIFVRGNKYVMDENKFKLTRVTNCDTVSSNKVKSNNVSKTPTCQRIDIGGYTYVSTNSAKNVLIRTSNHLSRAYVHNAKQKSLQTLARRLAKTNIPCPIFQRIGKCAAFEIGKCSKVHNKLQIAICSRFLRGECHNSNCLLSHNVSLSKMPVCKFYLQGVCVRNDCSYLHKKLSNTTELCFEFLRGFCQKADKCDKRHEFVCPEIERNKKCCIKDCQYCNARKRKELQIKLKSTKMKNQNAANLMLVPPSNLKDIDKNTENQSCKRYFIETCEQPIENAKETQDRSINDESRDNMEQGETPEENTKIILETRPKIGALPAYIPL